MSDKKPCPNCGHCPTCGRKDLAPSPYVLQPYGTWPNWPTYPTAVPYRVTWTTSTNTTIN